MGLISLAYVSTESRAMSNEDIMDILNTAREFNGSKNITGMLLYRDGYFIQALEGEEAEVQALYDKIAEDDRHQNVLMIHKGPIEKRSFKEWSMGFRNLEEIENPEEIPGYTDFLTEEFSSRYFSEQPSRAQRLLELFAKETNY